MRSLNLITEKYFEIGIGAGTENSPNPERRYAARLRAGPEKKGHPDPTSKRE